MKENVSMVTAVLAIIISIIAIASGVVIGPVSTIGASTIGENELADNSVTSGKVADGALTDADISDSGISKIADNAITSDQIASSSITLLHLTSGVIAAMTGVVDIANNSITGAKIAIGTITNTHISGSADIDPSKILGTAWTATNDGSGSGLDADKLDGKSSDEFADTIHSHSGLLLSTTVLDVRCTSIDVFSTDYKKILDVGTFTKLGARILCRTGVFEPSDFTKWKTSPRGASARPVPIPSGMSITLASISLSFVFSSPLIHCLIIEIDSYISRSLTSALAKTSPCGAVMTFQSTRG